IYSIALAQDMRSYGMLAVVGMTRGQLRYVIVLRSLILYLVTLPFGLAAGYFIGWRLLSPLMFMVDAEVASASLEFGFSPYIFVVGAAFALISLLLSALFPLRRLDRMSPITAVEYTLSDFASHSRNFSRKSRRAPTPLRLAGCSISRNRKKY